MYQLTIGKQETCMNLWTADSVPNRVYFELIKGSRIYSSLIFVGKFQFCVSGLLKQNEGFNPDQGKEACHL